MSPSSQTGPYNVEIGDFDTSAGHSGRHTGRRKTRVVARTRSLPEETKHPIIISSDGQLATLIIRDIHIYLGHASTERTLHSLRAQYHVLKPRATIHHLINNCFPCKLRDSQPEPPLMAPLPASRLRSHLPPFTHVGIDFFGPLTVVMLRRSIKRYGVMFTCFDCRAVHIEIAASMDLDSFMMAFSRFVDRRGLPRVCYSDNGSNLVAGEQEIRESLSNWNQDDLANRMTNRNVEWRFNPPAAPHFGGTWERLIKSAKVALRSILNHRSVSEEVLTTAMTGVEALLNARPLTHVSVNPTDLEALTPNHFLHGRAHPQVHFDNGDAAGGISKRRWLESQTLISHFWNRWLQEYVPNLIERRKWLRPRRNLAVGDIVLVVIPNVSRGTWPLGRIVRVFPGADGVIRSAEVKVTRALPLTKKSSRKSDLQVSTSYYIRPVHKLCLLEADNAADVSMAGNRAGNVPND